MEFLSSILLKHGIDRITGFSGIITAVVEYSNGTQEACVEPSISAQNSESRWLNIDRLTISDTKFNG